MRVLNIIYKFKKKFVFSRIYWHIFLTGILNAYAKIAVIKIPFCTRIKEVMHGHVHKFYENKSTNAYIIINTCTMRTHFK